VVQANQLDSKVNSQKVIMLHAIKCNGCIMIRVPTALAFVFIIIIAIIGN